MTEIVLTITQVVRRLGVSRHAIKIYEDEGFIKPERIGGRCLLRPKDVEKIFVIERLRSDLGVNVHGAGVILEMRGKMVDLQRRLTEMEQEFERRLEEALRLQRRELQHPLSLLNPGSVAGLGPRSLIKIDDEED